MLVFSNDRSFRDVEVKPNDSNSIFSANDFGIFRHYFDESEWQAEWLLKYSTWPPPLPEDEEWAYFVRALAFDPQNPDILYAHWRYSYAGTMYSRIARGLHPPYVYEDWEFYPVESLPANTFYTLTVHPSNSEWIFGGTNGLGVFKSQDHGQSWTPINNGINAVIVRDIGIDPDDPTHVFACTISGLYEKRGETWSRLLTYDTGSIRFHPTDSSILYIGLIGCLGKTTNGGTDWSYTCSFPSSLIDDIAIDPVDTSTMFVAVGTEIHKSTDGGGTFVQVLEGENQAGDSYAFNVVAIDPADHEHIFAGGGNFYAPKVLGDLWESTAGGAEGSWRRTSLHNVIVNALLIDPRDSNTIYAGCGYSGGTEVPAYKSTDGGATWAPSYQGIPGQAVILNDVWGSTGTNVFTVGSRGTILRYDGSSWIDLNSGTEQDLYAVWGSSGTDVFAVGSSGTILRYDGSAWSAMSSGTTELLQGVWGSSGTDVFAVGNSGGIFQYDANGWSVMRPGGKPWNAVTDLEFHSQNKNVVYASTNLQGVYVSPNQGRNWLNLGTPEYDVYAISISSLYAATEGGLWQCTGTGVIAGNITNSWNNARIDSATVLTDLGIETTSVGGEYMIVSPAGIFDITAQAERYHNRTSENIMVFGGDVTWAHLSMNPVVLPPTEPKHAMTASAGAHGSITPSGELQVEHLSDVTFTITPDEGYAVAEVTVDRVSVGAVTSYTFEKVAANHTIQATFTQVLTADPNQVVRGVGGFADIALTGGMAPYEIAVEDERIAGASLSENTLTVTCLSAGSTEITISDSASPPHTTRVSVVVTSGTPVGMEPGAVSEDVPADSPVTLFINVTNSRGDDPTDISQEWFVFTGIHGGVNLPLYVLTGDGQIVNISTVTDFSTMTYDFDHASDSASIATLSMAALGLIPGDVLMYGYAYTKTDVSQAVIENVVTLKGQ
jgi:hypothetical protein